MSLTATVELHDVHDVEGFVAATLRATGLQLDHHTREDLEAFGLMEMCQLARAYTPSHARRRDDWGTFAQYAAALLPKRLLTEWHRICGHRRTRDHAGRRGWDYTGEVSFEAALADPGFDERNLVVEFCRFTRAARPRDGDHADRFTGRQPERHRALAHQSPRLRHGP